MRAIAMVLLVGLGFACGCAGAVTGAQKGQPRCRVTGGEQLPAASGGTEALCGAIEQAVQAKAPGQGYSVEVRVLPKSMLAATVTTADGRTLPEQRFAVMDAALSKASFERFAQAIATALGQAGGK